MLFVGARADCLERARPEYFTSRRPRRMLAFFGEAYQRFQLLSVHEMPLNGVEVVVKPVLQGDLRVYKAEKKG